MISDTYKHMYIICTVLSDASQLYVKNGMKTLISAAPTIPCTYIENINMLHQSLSSSSMTAPFFLFLGGTTLKSSCIRKKNNGENNKIYIILRSPKSIYDAIMTKNHRILKFLWFSNLSSKGSNHRSFIHDFKNSMKTNINGDQFNLNITEHAN